MILEQGYGAITFSMGHKDEVDDELAARERTEDAFSETHPTPSELKEKLEGVRTSNRSRASSAELADSLGS